MPNLRALWPDPLFCAAGLMAWGVGARRPLLAAAMACLLLAAAASPWRLTLSERVRSRSNDWTFVLIAGAAMWYWLQRQSLLVGFGVQLLSLCPLLLYPKLLLSAAARETAGFSGGRDGAAVAKAWIESQFGFSRRHMDRRKTLAFPTVHFFLSIFIAAFSLPPRVGALVVVAGALSRGLAAGWNGAQSRRRGLAGALCAVVLAGAGSFGVALGVESAQQAGESFFSQKWGRRGDGPGSGSFADTRIGASGGPISLGGALMARVDWPLPPGGYLRDGLFASASFNGSSWRVAPNVGRVDAELSSISATNGGSFALAPPSPGAPVQARIFTAITQAKASVPLPEGSTEIFGWPLDTLEVNRMGVALAPAAAGYATLGATFVPGRDIQPAPSPIDLEAGASPAMLAALDEFLDAAGARGLEADAAARAIKARFVQGWAYSLEVTTPEGRPRDLLAFLALDRRGHCEYFATVSTLAMRRLGHPARYATGYLVHEFDPTEKLFWVRSRDAHAWSSYWNGSSWRSLDATPPGAGEQLEWDAPIWDQIARWRYGLDSFDFGALAKTVDNGWVWVAALLALAGIALRLGPQRRLPGAPLDARASQLTQRLESLTGLRREGSETSGAFWARAGALIPERSHALAELGRERDGALYAPVDDAQALLALTERQCAREIKALPRKLAARTKT